MKKNTDFSERINEVIDFLNVSKNVFAKKLGYERSQSIYDIANGKSKPSFDFFKRLLNSEFSEIISIEYLITGDGSLEKKKEQQKLHNESITRSITNNFKNETSIKSYTSKKNLPIQSDNNSISTEGVLIPLIPVEAMAGWGKGDVQVMDYETGLYKIPEFDNITVDFMIRVRGSSMYPKYNSGDTLACLKVELGVFFQWNKVYVLDTSQGAMVKRIRKSDKENHILCVSDNSNYDPFDLPLQDLFAIALVVGVIRME